MPFSYLLEPTGMSLLWPTRIRYSAGAFVYMPGKRSGNRTSADQTISALAERQRCAGSEFGNVGSGEGSETQS